MTVAILGIDQQYLELIRDRQKIWEGRLCNERYSRVQVGDRVTFQSATEQVSVVIEERIVYPSFQAMLEGHGVQAFLPHQHKTLYQAVEVYRSFPGYREGEASLGAIAFKVTPLTQN